MTVVGRTRGGWLLRGRALLAVQPQSPDLAECVWCGVGTRATGEWAARQGLNPLSSTLLSEDTDVPFDELQADRIARYREMGRGRLIVPGDRLGACRTSAPAA